MKYPKHRALLAAFLLLSVGVFAGTKNQATFMLPEPAQIGSAHLQPGKYKAEWAGRGPNVQVNFLQAKKTVATARAKLETYDRAVSQDAVVLRSANNGSEKQITEIDFSGGKEALVILPNR